MKLPGHSIVIARISAAPSAGCLESTSRAFSLSACNVFGKTLLDIRSNSFASQRRFGHGELLQVRAQAWKEKDSKNIDGRAKSLLQRLSETSGTRDEVVAVLDTWAAFQQDFPLLALKKALLRLKRQQNWERILQVSKWMLQKGHGRTFGTYSLMLETLARLGRDTEMDNLWDLILEEGMESTPRSLFAQVMDLYEEQRRPLKVLEVFGSMDSLGIRLDSVTIETVYDAFMAIGAKNQASRLLYEYQDVRIEWRHSNGNPTQMKSFGKRSGHDVQVEQMG